MIRAGAFRICGTTPRHSAAAGQPHPNAITESHWAKLTALASWPDHLGGAPLSNRARKSAILEKAEPVPEIASEFAEALRLLADEAACIGGSLAYIAAAPHSKTAGEQRQLAAVIYLTAKKQFGGVKYDGQHIDKATIEELDKMWLKMLGKPGR